MPQCSCNYLQQNLSISHWIEFRIHFGITTFIANNFFLMNNTPLNNL